VNRTFFEIRPSKEIMNTNMTATPAVIPLTELSYGAEYLSSYIWDHKNRCPEQCYVLADVVRTIQH
jgi:hypothetical protein